MAKGWEARTGEGDESLLPASLFHIKGNLHSQFALSGASSFSMSILLRPCEVCRMTSGSTPISLPILIPFVSDRDAQGGPAGMRKVDSRMPVLDNRRRRIYYGAVHIEQQPIKFDGLRGSGVRHRCEGKRKKERKGETLGWCGGSL